MFAKIALVSFLLAGSASCREIPDNIRAFYNSVKSQGQCNDVLASGFYAKESTGPDWDYCGDHLKDFNVLYHQGKNGKLLDMDVDCDGLQGGPADDGRCKKSTDTQTQSSFQDTLQSYNRGIKDLNANVMPYVVFGNKGKKGWLRDF
ncbi:hypothetical protein NQ176_g9317 [Zarea fungicola]|uniref:Uncharacterized protein n=1 Tax=Zarea fungicola TaxID=93591 RepID=A0ACC1MMC5_9HYPO|nr:hypothetical protein NQ176_g9317 [Lecanicillium fungicola]